MTDQVQSSANYVIKKKANYLTKEELLKLDKQVFEELFVRKMVMYFVLTVCKTTLVLS